jgi:UDPglucose 6-dehydrogenase
MKLTKTIINNDTVVFSDNLYDACQQADALLIVTEWNEFRAADKNRILENMNGNIIIDGRNIWRKSDFQDSDTIYE